MPRDATKRRILVATILGSAVVFLDSTVVNVALPALREDFDAGLATQQWVITAYLLTLSSLLLVGGSLGDTLGRRLVFEVGLVTFGLTSLLCAIAPNAEFLVVARALQGVAGALLVPSSLAIITTTFGESERGAAVGAWTAWTGIGVVIGPLAGGALIDAGSWRLIFALDVPVAAAALWLSRDSIPATPRRTGVAIDYGGATLCAVGLGGLVFGLIEQPEHGFAAARVCVPLIVGVVALAAFVLHERRATAPMLPLSLFAVRDFAVVNVVTFAVYAGLGGATFFLILFVQQVAGYSALEAGLVVAPITLILFAFSRLFGSLADRLGPRRFMAAGPLIGGAGLLLMLRVDADPSVIGDLAPAVCVFGLGLAITVAPLTATVLGAVDEERAGVASGINNAIARVAGLIAIAAVGALVSAAFAEELDDRLLDAPLTVAGQSALEDSRSRPLAGIEAGALPSVDRPVVEPAVREASVAGLHAGLLASALLMALGGLLSAVGISSRPRRRPRLSAVA